jgi:hypothetical protein
VIVLSCAKAGQDHANANEASRIRFIMTERA